MNVAEHKAEAERLLASVTDRTGVGGVINSDWDNAQVAAAQAHATLALVPDVEIVVADEDGVSDLVIDRWPAARELADWVWSTRHATATQGEKLPRDIVVLARQVLGADVIGEMP